MDLLMDFCGQHYDKSINRRLDFCGRKKGLFGAGLAPTRVGAYKIKGLTFKLVTVFKFQQKAVKLHEYRTVAYLSLVSSAGVRAK